MIRVAASAGPLTPAERYALDVLVDLSRLLPVDDPTADVVRLVVGDGPHLQSTLPSTDLGTGPIQFSIGDGEVWVGRGFLATVTAVAGAGAEQRSTARDRYERVPSTENPLVRSAGFREPFVNQLAAAFGAAVDAAAGRRPLRRLAPWPDGRRWAAALTHDLDVVSGWPLFAARRITELLAAGEVGRAAAAAAAGLAAVGRDPVARAVHALLDTERAAGFPATWFVLAGTPSLASWRAGDVTYRVEGTAARRLVEAVRCASHEVGLHGSFATLRSPTAFGAEAARLAPIAQGRIAGVRQHFLRFRPGETQRAMVAAGFAYDASYGFPDRNGFRLGTADSLPAWDDAAGTVLPLEEVPLTWMDRALSKYAGMHDPDRWVADALELARACRAVGGLWVGLWHPNLVPALGFPGADRALRRLIAGLLEDEPYVERLTTIVAWRRARRGVRARAVAPDGRLDLTADAPWDGELRLDDGDGRRVAVSWPAPRR